MNLLTAFIVSIIGFTIVDVTVTTLSRYKHYKIKYYLHKYQKLDKKESKD